MDRDHRLRDCRVSIYSKLFDCLVTKIKIHFREKEKRKKETKKEKKTETKKLNLLSFGDEAEEDEMELVQVNKVRGIEKLEEEMSRDQMAILSLGYTTKSNEENAIKAYFFGMKTAARCLLLKIFC